MSSVYPLAKQVEEDEPARAHAHGCWAKLASVLSIIATVLHMQVCIDKNDPAQLKASGDKEQQ